MSFDDYSSSPLPQFEEKYISKLAYPHLLFIQIQRIMDAIDMGEDGKEELENLKALLKPSWREEIDAKMERYEKEMEKEINRIGKVKERVGITTYREMKRRAIVKYVRRYVQFVIEKLDEVGLLLIEEHTVLRGGGMIT
ncbi:MAG: hypothetical protein EJNHJLOP_00024 [Methanophagales virus PBV082]|uniref:Uncharacterized protein n=1 Tax=Methanophagales virus PBV082 TaxID=3071307 RepID=A0AA46TEB2_9VIRU|nr:MAG: hypothetical protein QIT52_gp24 [Methanophagales virus PBV082]UYL64913.1 MAG: hypothetical protein EJNHJLOP_00024 [Methanophagales virus PBV082]